MTCRGTRTADSPTQRFEDWPGPLQYGQRRSVQVSQLDCDALEAAPPGGIHQAPSPGGGVHQHQSSIRRCLLATRESRVLERADDARDRRPGYELCVSELPYGPWPREGKHGQERQPFRRETGLTIPDPSTAKKMDRRGMELVRDPVDPIVRETAR